jgi:hypothetical protein
MTDIAKVYLGDIDVIADGRRELDECLQGWWKDIVVERLHSELRAINGGNLQVWENNSRPGMIHYRAAKDQELLLQLMDPRAFDRPCYTLWLITGKRGLSKIRNSKQATDTLDRLAGENQVGDGGRLDWRNTELARMESPIDPDDPEATADKLCELAARMFRIVIGHASEAS